MMSRSARSRAANALLRCGRLLLGGDSVKGRPAAALARNLVLVVAALPMLALIGRSVGVRPHWADPLGGLWLAATAYLSWLGDVTRRRSPKRNLAIASTAAAAPWTWWMVLNAAMSVASGLRLDPLSRLVAACVVCAAATAAMMRYRRVCC